MPMRYRPTMNPRERILVFGPQGSGKSKVLLDIARKCPGDTFYLWDNDFSAERLLSSPPETGGFSDVADREAVSVPDDELGVAWGNVVVRNGDPENWTELIDWLELVKKYNTPDDWVSVDSASAPWPAVQGWFTDQVFREGIEDYFLQVRIEKQAAKGQGKDKKTLGALDGWMDWPVINKQFNRFYRTLLNIGCHWVITAEIGQVADEDDKDVKNLFGPYGVKPVGQKSMGYKASTVLLLTKSRAGEYGMTTVKDRGRVEREDEPWGGFAADYLGPVAGWKMRKVEG